MQIPLKQYWNLLTHYLKPEWPRVLLLAVVLLGGIGLQLVNPQIMRYFIDTATSGGATQTLAVAAILFIGVALAQQCASVLATYLGENVGWTATNRLRADLVLHCLRLDMSFHKTRTPGEMIERIDGDVTALANFFTQFAIQVLGNSFLLVGVLIALFSIDWRAGLTLTGFAILTLATLNRIRDMAVPLWTLSRQSSAELFGFLEERLSGTEDIRATGAGAYVMGRLYRFLRELLQKTRRARLAGQFTFITGHSLFVLASAAGIALGAYLFRKGDVTIGTVYLIVHYIGLLAMPLEQITRQIQDLQKASASIGRVNELYHIHSTIPDGPGAKVPSDALSVEFQNISFEYDAGDTVLHGFSFRLQPGTVLGLLGRTGSGKTTLARLLFRLYDPTAGVIRLGDADIRALRLDELRKRVGVVTQDVQLFRATVRDNLTFFDRSISDEGILQAFRDLGLWEWLQMLPEGLDTMLAAGGGGVSAGEAQLLAFARVFLKAPGLVVLDEASSRLDPATEHLIEQAVGKLLKGRTAIIIAHRLTTVMRADEIMIIECRRIREHGAREHLAADPTSFFSKLMKAGIEEALV